jgi:hypothetical protein
VPITEDDLYGHESQMKEVFQETECRYSLPTDVPRIMDNKFM